MRRRLVTVASVLSLLICIGTVVLLTRSSNYCGLSLVDDSTSDAAVWNEWFVCRGELGVVQMTYDVGLTNLESFGFRGRHRKLTVFGTPSTITLDAIDLADGGHADWHFGGFSASAESGYRAVIVPLWVVFALSCLLPIIWTIAPLKRNMRRFAGRCQTCGYNLTGNTSGVCPECGTPVAQKAPWMRRRLLTITSFMPLLFLIATAALWARSYWICDLFYVGNGKRSAFIQTGGGQFRLECTRVVWASSGYSGFAHQSDRADGRLQDCERMPGSGEIVKCGGFWLVTGERWGDYHYAAFVPGWFLMCLASVLPAFKLWRIVKGRAKRSGCCATCGYNLTGNTSGVCPECGTSLAESIPAHSHGR